MTIPKTEHDAHGKPSEAWLRCVYLEEQRDVADIAAAAQRHPRHIYWLLKRYGIPVREKERPFDATTLERLYWTEGLSLRAIGDRYGISDTTVWWWMLRYDIPLKQPKPRKEPVDRGWLERRHFVEKVPWTVIRDELGYSRVGFHYLLDRLGIERRKRVRVKAVVSRDELYQMHVVDGLTAVKIAARLGCNHGTISRLIKRYELVPDQPLVNLKREPPISREDLERLYVGEGLSCAAIGQRHGASTTTVNRWMLHYAIARRTGKRGSSPSSRVYTRSGTPSTRGGYEFNAEERYRIMERDGWRCQMPGCARAVRQWLEVHHIVPIEHGGTNGSENGISLCRTCHIRIKGRELDHVTIFQEIVNTTLSGVQTRCIGETPATGNPDGSSV